MFILSSVVKHLNYFHVLTITSNMYINIYVQGSLWTYVFITFKDIPIHEFLAYTTILSILFFHMCISNSFSTFFWRQCFFTSTNLYLPVKNWLILDVWFLSGLPRLSHLVEHLSLGSMSYVILEWWLWILVSTPKSMQTMISLLSSDLCQSPSHKSSIVYSTSFEWQYYSRLICHH